MLRIVNIGMNHETAPVEVRECLATAPESTKRALYRMRDMDCISEGLFISTCNRVEALVVTEDPDRTKKEIVSLMSRLGALPEESFADALYAYEDMDAVRHVFTVGASLESMVVGEPQILGQMKESYAEATREKTSGVIINRLMHRAFHTAKRVRTETGINEAAVSISYAAVELAKKIFHELDDKSALLIGAGEMAELAAWHLMRQGVRSISVANRTMERAVRIAEQLGACAVSFEEMESQLIEADIVVASTASTEFVITYEQVKHVLKKRRNRPLFFIDIAVPRDVDPSVNNLGNVYVYDIDDLKGTVKLNMVQREREAKKAERIVLEEALKFEKWLKTLAVVPTIISLREKGESILKNEFKKSHSALQHLTPEEKEAVMGLMASIVDKLLNDPIVFLKGRADRPSLNQYLDVTRKLFRLDEAETVHGGKEGQD